MNSYTCLFHHLQCSNSIYRSKTVEQSSLSSKSSTLPHYQKMSSFTVRELVHEEPTMSQTWTFECKPFLQSERWVVALRATRELTELFGNRKSCLSFPYFDSFCVEKTMSILSIPWDRWGNKHNARADSNNCHHDDFESWWFRHDHHHQNHHHHHHHHHHRHRNHHSELSPPASWITTTIIIIINRSISISLINAATTLAQVDSHVSRSFPDRPDLHARPTPDMQTMFGFVNKHESLSTNHFFCVKLRTMPQWQETHCILKIVHWNSCRSGVPNWN